MSTFKTLDDVDVRGKRVLVRADLNLPVDGGKVIDITRIERVGVTLRELSDKGAKVVVLSHFGRPKGAAVSEMSLRQVLDAVADTLERSVSFADDCVGPAAEQAVSALTDGDILLLENTRFHAGEEANDPAFAQALAQSGDIYVNDSFSVSHRAHASTEGLAHCLPGFAGRALEAELKALGAALEDPEHPIVAIVGGAKISTKLDVLGHLIEKVDQLVIGGAMANTFLAALGKPVGKSLCEHDLTDKAQQIMNKAKTVGCEVVLPIDVVVAETLTANTAAYTVPVDQVPSDMMILDVGTDTIAYLATCFEAARTVVWNGPFGAFEFPPFDNATNAAARHVAMLTQAGRLLSVAGGGDTLAALNNAGVIGGFSYVSAAGGAFLEWLEGKTLPGIAALSSP